MGKEQYAVRTVHWISAQQEQILIFHFKGIYRYEYLSILPTFCSNRLQLLVPVQATQHKRKTQLFFSERYLPEVGLAGLTADMNGPHRYCPLSCAECSCRVLMPTFWVPEASFGGEGTFFWMLGLKPFSHHGFCSNLCESKRSCPCCRIDQQSLRCADGFPVLSASIFNPLPKTSFFPFFFPLFFKLS